MGFFDFLKKKKNQDDIIEPQETTAGLKTGETEENAGQVISAETNVGDNEEAKKVKESTATEEEAEAILKDENSIAGETTNNDSGGDLGDTDVD